MVNASLNWASIVGIVLAVGGAFLYFMRSFKPALARDYDVFFAAVGLLCGGILFFQGWRLDPILQFGQFLLAGTTVFFAYESVRLRGVTTEQARRSSYFDDDEPTPAPRPRMGGGRDWRDDADRFDEPQPLRRRIRSREDGYGDSEEEDFYRPRRAPARAAIPERAASRDDWGQGRDQAPSGAPGTSRYRAGSAPGESGTREFGARRQGREETRRGSRPSSTADDLPRSSRRPGTEQRPSSEARPAGVPQGAPYRPPAASTPTSSDEAAVSDAEFRPVPPSSRPRDNSSRFDD
ncbi:MAG: hypothetical protein RLZZ186_164 [Cyanobacteriota bacterium]